MSEHEEYYDDSWIPDGRVICDKCKGHGEYWDHEEDQEEICSVCNWLGHISIERAESRAASLEWQRDMIAKAHAASVEESDDGS